MTDASRSQYGWLVQIPSKCWYEEKLAIVAKEWL